MKDNIIELQIEGMHCVNCAATIQKYLDRKGMDDAKVDFATQTLRMKAGNMAGSLDQLKYDIRKLGFKVVEEQMAEPWWTLERKVGFAALLTLPLLLQHLLMVTGLEGFTFLHNPWVQLAMSLPVYVLGVFHFGKSSWNALRLGTTNMDVLIFLGSTAAFAYSLVGLILQEPAYYFFETSSTIITIVLFGNLLEKRAVRRTTSAIDALARMQPETALKVMPSGATVSLNVEDLQIDDLVQINEGDKVPVDGILQEGTLQVNEAMITGESAPVLKKTGDHLMGGTTAIHGNGRIRVTATGDQTTLSQMVELVKAAQRDKPNLQRLADRISAIFVPLVVGIALLTFVFAHFVFQIPATKAIMNAVAVLVISCPCALGLATPTAVMVGVGMLARAGILIRGGQTIELVPTIRKFVFDKTGTLTTGDLSVASIEYLNNDEPLVHSVIRQLESRSSHPIARSLINAIPADDPEDRYSFPRIDQVVEEKGVGVKGRDAEGHTYRLGSHPGTSNGATPDLALWRNEQLIAQIYLQDELRKDTASVIAHLKNKNIEPVLLSGDREEKTQAVAKAVGIEKYFAGKKPEEKLALIEQFSAETPTAMVGDGINDAAALSRANLGISLSNASDIARESAQMILLGGELSALPKALRLSEATLQTIRQNLFWAFAYNIVAIPMAAMGYLSPMWAALFMAISDVVVIFNSLRLKIRKT